MKRLTCALMVLVAANLLAAEPQGFVQQFVKMPLPAVMKKYASLTDSTVERVMGVSALILIPAGPQPSTTEAIAMIESALAEKNIRLFKIDEKRFVAAWIDPTRAPVMDNPSIFFDDLMQPQQAEPAAPAGSAEDAEPEK